ncbi:amidase [Streptomyces sp. NPDC060065]|uniref:amidase n=1 Tax=Streptomyces sp. NPDC060065 TaxID=3347050 RepID=UPI0036CC6D75
MTRPWAASAHQMLDELRSGRISAVELVRECLDRITQVNPALNAVVVLDADAALAQAREVDDARARGGPVGPLAGLPYTAKLDYDVEGQATSQGATILKDEVAAHDGPMIRRMRQAGAVLLGRTNEPDLGIVYHTNSSLYGPTRNAWASDRSPGGSSGGEGAAVSSGMSPLGLGSDIGGSIRGPASFNGIVGFKPGLGRYPDYLQSDPEPPIHEQLFVGRGPLARSVRDLALADAVLRGVDASDPWSSPSADGGRPPRRVGVVYSPTDTAVPDEIVRAIDDAANALAIAGYEVDETRIDNWPELVDTFTDIMENGFGGDPSTWQALHKDTAFFLEHVHTRRGKSGPAGERLATGLAKRHRLGVEFNAFHSRFDALLMPTWADQPFLSGALTTAEGIEQTMAAGRHLYIFNLLGLPALSMPVAVADGLPVGLHISSLRHQEPAVLTVALDLEDQIGTFTPIDPRGAQL